MAYTTKDDFNEITLSEIAKKLEHDYYEVIETYCSQIEKLLTALNTGEYELPSLYLSLCLKLSEKTSHHLRLRKMVTLPYLYQLQEKVADKHDCSTCKDGCQINHSLRAGSIKDMHKQIKEILYRLQLVDTPWSVSPPPHDAYRQLSDEMVKLDTKLTELFHLEDTMLLPKIIEAQRQIHVRH